jgi:S-adenosylmethionine hydrolase
MLIALLTDFGTEDAYVGVMKGVILSIAPTVQIVDITHAIQPQNVRQAAFTLMNVRSYFPAGTVFVVVVDPGVGSARRAAAVSAGQYTFVAPDNGVLSYALSTLGTFEARLLSSPLYQLTNVSNSFHGRDIFAPAAGHLAAGVPLGSFGPPVTDLVKLPLPLLNIGRKKIVGEVLHIDHYGNIVTSIGQLQWVSSEQLTLRPRFLEKSDPVEIDAANVAICVGGQQLNGIRHSFSDVTRGQLLAMVGSSGHLEIALNYGSAAAQLGVSLGDEVVLTIG